MYFYPSFIVIVGSCEIERAEMAVRMNCNDGICRQNELMTDEWWTTGADPETGERISPRPGWSKWVSSPLGTLNRENLSLLFLCVRWLNNEDEN